jgi:hypothetical protein
MQAIFRRSRRQLAALCALALVAAGCGGSQAADSAAAGTGERGDSPVTASDRSLDAGVGAARADLAQRLGVEPASIELVSAREVTWPDGSLGCPQPGMSYTQALVDGSQIILRHGGIDYHYHAGGARDPFYCPDPRPPVPEGAGGSDR